MAVKYNTMRIYKLALKLWVGLSLIAFGPIAWAQSLASLESPSPEAFVESGVGLIRGWVCQAERVEISINGGPLQAVAYGSRRADTIPVCGQPNTGFGLTFPWYALGEGVHNLRAFADGVEFANANFTVAALGAEFLTGLQGEYTLPDFPLAGRSPRVRWSEPHQNFVFARALSIPNAPSTPNNPRARLESPSQGSFESGIGLIRGWVCEAERVEISINGGPFQAVAYGTRRADTIGVCGAANTGFGLTFPWYALGDGVHNLKARADEKEFANVNFAVTTLGERDFLRGFRRKQALDDFPSVGQTTEILWSEPHQNFIVAKTTATAPKVGILSAITDRANRFAGLLAGSALQSDAIGMQAAKNASGQATQVTGFTWSDPKSGESADLELTNDGLPAVYRGSDGTEARLENLTATAVTVRFSRGGQAVADPVTVPINGSFLQTLQAFANQLRSTVQSAETSNSGWVGLAREDQSVRAAKVESRGFSLNGLFVNTVWSGGVATGETLCAVQRAAERTGLLGQIAARAACQSTTVDSFLRLAGTLSAVSVDLPVARANKPMAPRASVDMEMFRQKLDASFDLIDPVVQRALRFEEDVPEAPCGTTDSNAACLIPAAREVQQREVEAGTPIPPEKPQPTPEVPNAPQNLSASDGIYSDRISVTWSAVENAESYEVYRSTSSHSLGELIGSPTAPQFDDTNVSPDIEYWYQVRACNSAGCSVESSPDSGYVRHTDGSTRSYTGQSTICFKATANFGARGACPEVCASGGAQATIQDGELKIDFANFALIANFDSRGVCTNAELPRSGQLSATGTASGGALFYSYIITDGSFLATVNMEGPYSETSMSASGTVRFNQQGPLGTVTFDMRENIDLRGSAR